MPTPAPASAEHRWCSETGGRRWPGPRARPAPPAGQGAGGGKLHVIPAGDSRGRGAAAEEAVSCGGGAGLGSTAPPPPPPWLPPRPPGGPAPSRPRGASELGLCTAKFQDGAHIHSTLGLWAALNSWPAEVGELHWEVRAQRRWPRPAHPFFGRAGLSPALALGKLGKESGARSSINPSLPKGSCCGVG